MSFSWYLRCFLIIFGDWFWTVVSTVFVAFDHRGLSYIYNIIFSVWISVLRLNVALRLYNYAYIRVQPIRVDTCTTLGCILDSKIPRFAQDSLGESWNHPSTSWLYSNNPRRVNPGLEDLKIPRFAQDSLGESWNHPSTSWLYNQQAKNPRFQDSTKESCANLGILESCNPRLEW